MTNREWLYCNDEWLDIINIIKLEKDYNKRLCEFHDIIKRDEITIQDINNEWSVVKKSDIKLYVNEWFYNDNLEDAINDGSIIYWFFNIYTGEAVHIKYSVKINCSDIIVD